MAGEVVQSQALSKQAKYTMLVLLRGGWCPFCRQQMRELIKRRVAFQEIGCQVCFITPLNISDDVKLPRKLPRGFMLLQDRGLAMSTSLGLTGVNRTMMLAKIPQVRACSPLSLSVDCIFRLDDYNSKRGNRQC